MLDDVNVALGVTGSIAAVRCVEFIHELRRRGATVRVVMTPAATGIVHPWSLEFASDAPVVEQLTGAVEHIELCGADGWADVLVIAPATANTIGKIAHAIDDTTVTTCATTAIGADIPLVIAPAMHEPMADHPGVEANIDRVKSTYDATIVPPVMEEGKAKLADTDTLALDIARRVSDQPLAGQPILVSSGATREPIDPVRVLTTRASGRMGRAIARALYVLGAEIELLQATEESLPYATVTATPTAGEMERAALAALDDGIDAFVSAAAVSDYTVEYREEKIPSGEDFTLELEQTPKVIASVSEGAPSLPVVGFKAIAGDDERLIASARDLLERHDLSFVVANDIAVMGAADTRVLIVDQETVSEVEGTKTAVGMAIARRLSGALGDDMRPK